MLLAQKKNELLSPAHPIPEKIIVKAEVCRAGCIDLKWSGKSHSALVTFEEIVMIVIIVNILNYSFIPQIYLYINQNRGLELCCLTLR